MNNIIYIADRDELRTVLTLCMDNLGEILGADTIELSGRGWKIYSNPGGGWAASFDTVEQAIHIKLLM